MQAERPTQLIDPVCGMTVDVGRAEAAGLLLEHEDRTYGFCRSGCRAAFVDDPAEYVARAEAAVAPATAEHRPGPARHRRRDAPLVRELRLLSLRLVS